MTLLQLLTAICFTLPPFFGIVSAGKEAGAVGFMIGISVGLGAGGLAYYALQWTYEFWAKLDSRFRSQSRFVMTLIEGGIVVWLVFLIVGAALMAIYSTKFIVQQMAG